MGNILYTELYKLKSSKMLWLIVIGAVLPVLIPWWGAFYSRNGGVPMPMESVFWNVEVLMQMVLAPLLFYLFTGYLVAREYQEKTINSLFTYPLSRSSFYIGKLVIMFLVITATFFLTYFLMIMGGWLYSDGEMNLGLAWRHLQIWLLMVLAQFALIPVAFSVSFLGKSYIPAIILASMTLVATPTIFAAQSKFGILYPWAAPVFLLGQLSGEYPVGTFWVVVVLVVTFVAAFAFNLYYLKHSDVHSGS